LNNPVLAKLQSRALREEKSSAAIGKSMGSTDNVDEVAVHG